MTEDKAFLSDTKLHLKVPVLIPYQGITKNTGFIYLFVFWVKKLQPKNKQKSKSLEKSCEINDKKVPTLFMVWAGLKKVGWKGHK